MRKLLFLILTITAFTSCKKRNVWTKTYEQNIYVSVDSGLRGIMKDSSQRKDFSLYMVSKLKEMLPLGISSIPGDSLKRLSAKIGAAYEASHKSRDFKAMIPWSKETVLAIRNSMEQRIGNKFSQQAKDKYCDCVIAQLKLLYPDSLATPISDNTTTAVNTACISVLIKK